MQRETEHQQEISPERPAEDEEPERRVREPVSFGMSIAGTVAAFVAGFGILPSSTLAEKTFIFIIAIALSGAIISGIGAWRSVKRFVVMAISASLAFVCLAALAVAAQDGAVAPQAQATASRTSAVSKQPVTDTTSVPATTGTAPGVTGQPSGAATSGGYVLKYSQQNFTLPGDGDGCQSIEYNSYVLFSGQGPQVTPDPNSVVGEPSVPWDMIMNCFGDSERPDIEFSGSAAPFSGVTNPDACQKAINTDPMSTGIKFATLEPGKQVCMNNNAPGEADDELILVTLQSVSTVTYNTTWTATVWSLPPTN
jgi:hypothetical protein